MENRRDDYPYDIFERIVQRASWPGIAFMFLVAVAGTILMGIAAVPRFCMRLLK